MGCPVGSAKRVGVNAKYSFFDILRFKFKLKTLFFKIKKLLKEVKAETENIEELKL